MTHVLPDAGYHRRPFGRLAPTGMVLLNPTENPDVQPYCPDGLSYLEAHTTLRASVRKSWQKADRKGVLGDRRLNRPRRKAHCVAVDVANFFYSSAISIACALRRLLLIGRR
jgi:hypothetical protein